MVVKMVLKKKYCEFVMGLCTNGIEGFVEENKVFAAYSSHNPEIVGMIENGLAELNVQSGTKWISWSKDIDIENKIIFCEICENICKSKSVLIELSDLNFNVLFEYGYALVLDKKIHPTVNEAFDYEDIDRFIKPLLGIGIAKYEKNRFAQKIMRKRYWEKEKSNSPINISSADILGDSTEIESNSILYIKNCDKQDVSENIEAELEQSELRYIIDDPLEEINGLMWYCKQLKKSFAVIIDLGLSSKKENMNHYLKCAFIAGLCIGSGRRTLIINSVHAQKPSDIIQLIKPYSSAKEAKKIVSKFISQVHNNISLINSYLQIIHSDKISSLGSIDLGEHVAENDLHLLEKSFVETPEYMELSKPGYKLFIGRKGTGKSAAFQKFNMTQHQNAYVVSKLFNQYNMDDIYNLTTAYETDNDRNKVVTAFWKYVLLSLVAKSLYTEIMGKQLHVGFLDEPEEEFITYYNDHLFFNHDKSITEHLVEIVEKIKSKGIIEVKLLQAEFYSNEIIQLLQVINKKLNHSKKHLYVNIDGLDSNITFKNNPSIISLIVFNLHEVCLNLFNNQIPNSTANLFMREDIYDTLKEKITQKDKVNKIFYRWEREALFFLINKRLNENNVDNIVDLLSEEFNAKNLTQKLSQYVFNRPRDYVFIFNSFIQIARYQKLDKIDSKVFNEALDYYSFHIYESIEAEILTLPFKIDFGDFLNGIKHLINDSDKIYLEYLQQLLENQTLNEYEQNILIGYLLKVEFMVYVENNNQVNWSKLIDPDTKLKYIFTHSKERKYFVFHPIIKYLLQKHF